MRSSPQFLWFICPSKCTCAHFSCENINTNIIKICEWLKFFVVIVVVAEINRSNLNKLSHRKCKCKCDIRNGIDVAQYWQRLTVACLVTTNKAPRITCIQMSNHVHKILKTLSGEQLNCVYSFDLLLLLFFLSHIYYYYYLYCTFGSFRKSKWLNGWFPRCHWLKFGILFIILFYFELSRFGIL